MVVLRLGWLVKVWLAMAVIVAMSDAIGSIASQYIFYRYGVTAVFIVFLFIIGIFMAVIFGCCSVPLAKCVGEIPFASYRVIIPIGIGSCLFTILNTTAVAYFPWAIAVGFGVVGEIVLKSWTRRMVPYNLQATTLAMFLTCNQFAQLVTRFPYTLLFESGSGTRRSTTGPATGSATRTRRSSCVGARLRRPPSRC